MRKGGKSMGEINNTQSKYFVTHSAGCIHCDSISKQLPNGDFEWLTYDDIVNRLNQLNDENERLKLELKKYHKRFDCHQCHYHNYDGLNIDDEYEVCDKGNNEALDDNHSCSEWEEL